jgi:hypothetical protein
MYIRSGPNKSLNLKFKLMVENGGCNFKSSRDIEGCRGRRKVEPS